MAAAGKVRTGAVRGLTRGADIEAAVAAVKHVPPHVRPAVRRHIMRKAKGIKGAARHIPPHWHPSGAIRHVRPAQALALAEAAGVTLDLANDLNLAGRWKHGWIPLDAVAAAVKAKRYHGGPDGGRSVRGKGRLGSATEARREPSRGRVKGALPTRGRTFSDAGEVFSTRREHGLSTGGRKAAKANPVGAPLEHQELRYVMPPPAGGASDKVRAAQISHPVGASVEARQPGIEKVTHGKVVGHDEAGMLQVEYTDRHGKAVTGRFNPHHVKVTEQPSQRKSATVNPHGAVYQDGRSIGTVQQRGSRWQSSSFHGDLIGWHGSQDEAVTAVQAHHDEHPLLGSPESDARIAKINDRAKAAVRMKAPELRAAAAQGDPIAQAELDRRAGKRAERVKASVGKLQQVAQDRTRRVQNAQVAKDEAKARAAADAGSRARKGDLALLNTTTNVSVSRGTGASFANHQLVRVAGTNKDGMVTHYRELGSDPKRKIPAPTHGRITRIPRGQLDEAAVEREHTGFYHDQFPTVEDARAALLRHHLTNPREPEPGRGLTMQQQRVRRMSDEALANEAKYHPDDSAVKAELARREADRRPKAEAPPAEGGAGGIRIEHSGDGTLVHGTERGDKEATAALKGNGFKWSSNLGAWYLPRNWSESTRAAKVGAVQAALGDRVAVDRGSVAKSTTAAERAAERTRRDAELAAAHTAQAGKLGAEADRRFGAAKAIGDHIPSGQPVLVGHHSEGRHRRDLARIDSNMRAGVAAHKASEGAAHRASEAAARVRLATNPQALSRRIDRNSAELRRLDRILNGTGKEIHGQDKPHPPGEHRDRLEAMRAELADSIEHDRQTVAAAGAPQHSSATVNAGDYVRIRGSLLRVEKSNPKTVTVKSHGLTLKYPYSEIQAHSTTEALLSRSSDAQLQAFIYSKRGTPEAAVAQQILDERKRQAG